MNYLIHYSRWHDGSDQDYTNATLMYTKVLGDFVTKDKSQNVLDYGCGSGLLVNYLQKFYQNVEGVDASKELIEIGLKRKLPLKLVRIEDFDEWAASNISKYDLIFLFDVLEHIPVEIQFEFLQKLTKTLNPNGQILIKVPNANGIIPSRWRYIDWTHTSIFSEESLEFLTENVGLKKLEYLPDETSLKRKLPLIPRKGMLNYYVKKLYRFIHAYILYLETGTRYNNLGSNLLGVFKKE